MNAMEMRSSRQKYPYRRPSGDDGDLGGREGQPDGRRKPWGYGGNDRWKGNASSFVKQSGDDQIGVKPLNFQPLRHPKQLLTLAAGNNGLSRNDRSRMCDISPNRRLLIRRDAQ